MEALPLPNRAQVAHLEGNKYKMTLEPLYPGYGVTIGNALRRVLLSSMPGSAVTAVKIKFVDHEFSTIPNVKEDVIQIILNLKQLRLRSTSSEPVRLSLKVKGDRVVTAADITETDQVQVVNKDLHIATLDSKTAELEMDLIVEQGRGYVPVEAREAAKAEFTDKAQAEGKPAAMIEKIVEGMLKKHFAERCLLEQPFIKNPDQTVGDYLKEHIAKLGENIVVRRFNRMALGEVAE